MSPFPAPQGFDADETAWADAASVADDTVVEQVENAFDAAGNLLSAARSMRMHTATDDQVGPLNGLSGPDPRARVMYTANWYDAVGRQIASADYGTTAPSPLTGEGWGEGVPDRSDAVLVTSVEYSDRGEAFRTIDAAGRESRQFFDDTGRTVKTVRNYVDGVVDGDHPDEDVTVETTLTADGQIATLTACNPATGDQVTRYVYGTTLTDSAVARTDLLRAEIYPDSDDTISPLGNGPDGVYDRVEYAYNRQGQRVTKIDQNGTVHTYYYDALGRLQDDCVTTLAEGIDGTVRRIGIAYDLRDLPMQITSYNNPTPGQQGIVNQVRLEYNAFGLLVTDYQEHAGAVNLSNSPKVGYVYSDGSANHARRVATVYPNGRVLLYEYDPGVDDSLSRVTRIADDLGSGPGSSLVEYQRLGLNTFVETDYPEPQLRCDLAHGTGTDPYAGLDRFGRIVDLRWWTNTSIAEDVERIRHGYDRAGNRLWRECPVAESFGKHFDELYSYDGMDQLISLQRGDLNAQKTGLVTGTKNFAEDWSLDMTGNWPQYRQDANGDGTWDLDQLRSHNAANEIVTINGSLAHVAHDRAGNTTYIPRSPVPPAGEEQGEGGLEVLHLRFGYDAWNRLVRVSLGESPDTVAEYQYDGRHYRILKKVYGPHGYPPATRHSYYSDQWQVLEERLGEAETADRQFIWGLRYIDDLVLRDRDSMGYSTLDARLYALQDPNWNVTAIVAPDGAVMERYSYQAYGHVLASTPAFGNRGVSAYEWESLFTGRRLDNESDLYDYRARLDRSDLGRFLGRDPIGFGGEDSNLYRYAFDAPTVYTDPAGKAATLPTPLIGSTPEEYDPPIPLPGKCHHEGDIRTYVPRKPETVDRLESRNQGCDLKWVQWDMCWDTSLPGTQTCQRTVTFIFPADTVVLSLRCIGGVWRIYRVAPRRGSGPIGPNQVYRPWKCGPCVPEPSTPYGPPAVIA